LRTKKKTKNKTLVLGSEAALQSALTMHLQYGVKRSEYE